MADADDEPSAALLAARAAAGMQAAAPMSSRMLDGFGLPASDGSVIPAGTPPVRLNVSFTSSQKTFQDVNMSVGMAVAQLKEQLFAHVQPRPPPQMQKLTLHHLDGSVAAELGADTDRALLASYGPLNGAGGGSNQWPAPPCTHCSHLAGTAASIRSLAGWEVRVHDSEAGSAQQPDGGGEANAGEEAGASWATQVSDWSTFPKPPDSKRG